MYDLQNMTDAQCRQAMRKYAGQCVDALCTRMGGKFATIYCATEYQITSTGTLIYVCEWQNCVANKTQKAAFNANTPNGWIDGRPTARKVLSALNAGSITIQK